jgi:hypothetical protein
MSHIYASLRSSLATRRATAQAHRDLARELAAFDTASDLLELDAMLERHSEEDGREIRSILRGRLAKAA